MDKVARVILRRGIGSTHAPKQWARWLKEQKGAWDGQLRIRVARLPVNASWLDPMEMGLRIVQRKRLLRTIVSALTPGSRPSRISLPLRTWQPNQHMV